MTPDGLALLQRGRFGNDRSHWQFGCPRCGHRQSIASELEHVMSENPSLAYTEEYIRELVEWISDWLMHFCRSCAFDVWNAPSLGPSEFLRIEISPEDAARAGVDRQAMAFITLPVPEPEILPRPAPAPIIAEQAEDTPLHVETLQSPTERQV